MWVGSRSTRWRHPGRFLFPGHSIKAPPVDTVSLGARVAAKMPAGGPASEMTLLASGFFVPTRHLAPIGASEPDFVATAERFVGVPYLWGGKTSLGVDCSGLVQIALTASGIICPRDSDMQERSLGQPLRTDDPTGLRRGDLIFWKGHVAILRDATSLVHANAFHMAVSIEPVVEAVCRIAESGSPVTAIKRIG